MLAQPAGRLLAERLWSCSGWHEPQRRCYRGCQERALLCRDRQIMESRGYNIFREMGKCLTNTILNHAMGPTIDLGIRVNLARCTRLWLLQITDTVSLRPHSWQRQPLEGSHNANR